MFKPSLGFSGIIHYHLELEWTRHKSVFTNEHFLSQIVSTSDLIISVWLFTQFIIWLSHVINKQNEKHKST